MKPKTQLTIKKGWIYVAFFTVLLGIFYWALYDEAPFHEAKLSVINANIPPFEFVNQNEKTISQKNTEGKVYVAAYFFTTCKGICPKMNINMRRVYDVYKNESDFLIISHTCMPEVDSPSLLKKYEALMLGGTILKNTDGSYRLTRQNIDSNSHIENKNWHFVTGNKKDLYQLARQGYMIDNGNSDSNQMIQNQFIHTQFFALVDRYGRVRGIYDGLKEDEIQKLINDISALLKEKIDHTRFLNGFSNSPN